MSMRRLDRTISVIALSLFASTIAFTAFAEDAKPAAPAAPIAAQRYGTWGVDLDGMDRSVKPGDDFFKYVNGKWAATTQIPADKTAIRRLRQSSAICPRTRVHTPARPRGRRQDLEARLRTRQKVAAVYRTYLDEATRGEARRQADPALSRQDQEGADAR